MKYEIKSLKLLAEQVDLIVSIVLLKKRKKRCISFKRRFRIRSFLSSQL